MLEIEGGVKSEVKLTARVLDGYTNADILLKPGKNSVKKEQGSKRWLICCQDETFLVEAFRKIHRAKYGSIKYFNSRLANYERDRASLLPYSF